MLFQKIATALQMTCGCCKLCKTWLLIYTSMRKKSFVDNYSRANTAGHTVNCILWPKNLSADSHVLSLGLIGFFWRTTLASLKISSVLERRYIRLMGINFTASGMPWLAYNIKNRNPCPEAANPNFTYFSKIHVGLKNGSSNL
jgi:hypothetical protein